MSNELQTTEQKRFMSVSKHGAEIQNMGDLFKFANCVHASGIAPKSYKTVEQIVVGIQTGMELGFSPMASLKAVAVINGVPCVWGDGLKALVERSPDCEYVKEWIEGEGDKMVAHCEAKRRGRPEPSKQSFGYDDAKKAGLLGKDTYKAYQRRMLQMRARSWACRDAFPDLLQGLYVAEEVQDHDAIEGQLLPGDPAPKEGVRGMLEAMDADEGIEDETEADDPLAMPWETIEQTDDDDLARSLYDDHCGPGADCDQETKERCQAAWNKRNNIMPTEEAKDLFGNQ